MVRQLKQDTWRNLNLRLADMSEKECADALKAELKAKTKRASVVFRIHSRMNKLRAEREREELTAKLYSGE